VHREARHRQSAHGVVAMILVKARITGTDVEVVATPM
jgi:hypothetical protein